MTARLASLRALLGRLPFCRDRSAENAIGQITHGGAFELPRRAPGQFFATVNGVAEHSCHCVVAAQKVHLKSVGLFLRLRFGINAADVCFGIRIGSFFHTRLPNEWTVRIKSGRAMIKSQLFFYAAILLNQAAANSSAATFVCIP